MNQLLSLESFTAIYDILEETVHANIHVYKKHFNKYPPWCSHKGKLIYIDPKVYFRYDRLYRESYTYANTRLYWVLHDHFGINDYQLAELLAKTSHKYTSKSSWNQFLSVDLWNESMQTRVSPKYTKIEDFVRIGSWIAYKLIKAQKSLSCDTIITS